MRSSSSESTEDVTPITPPLSPELHVSPLDKHIRKRRTYSLPQSFDLSKPLGSALPSPPVDDVFGQSTPLGQASRAMGAFPFPQTPDALQSRSFPSRLSASGSSQAGPSLSRAGSQSQRKRSRPSSDRFIPLRRSPSSSTSFHMNKPVNTLSSAEKILRRRSASPDPFSTTFVPRPIPPERIRAVHHPPALLNQRPGSLTSSGILGIRRQSASLLNRQASLGAVWNVGGQTAAVAGPIAGVPDGRGGMLGSGTNAPMYNSAFLQGETPDQDLEKHQGRLALALDVDRTNRILGVGDSAVERGSPETPSKVRSESAPLIGKRKREQFVEPRTVWRNGEWTREGSQASKRPIKPTRKPVPLSPFRVLDAPALRDDYYCSLLAFSHTVNCLAVGLDARVYLWSEKLGVQHPPDRLFTNRLAYVASLSFSSTEGGHSILAIGKADGHVLLWSPFDKEERFEIKQPTPISCLAFKPKVTRRISARDSSVMVDTEELLVGNEIGDIHFYSVEWTNAVDRSIHNWDGAVILIARIAVHSQQICGLAWSPDGDFFASGANDNACCYFETNQITGSHVHTDLMSIEDEFGRQQTTGRQVLSRVFCRGREKRRWLLNAAIKAIAFCPWQRGLIAIGGGSNDRGVHFYHTFSGACLATINVAAQVTSLIWSTNRREIAVTFGYAQPEHPFRIAVFSWPDCQQVLAIPWLGEMRALYAIPYPGGPEETRPGESGSGHEEDDRQWWTRTNEEGCIVVASSDESVKFHEVWSGTKRMTGGNNKGLLGGSDILESLHGIDKEGPETIR
ncbi:WD40 repeat-like protein [Xylona heveae TC161]|uniref:WD40 repeat-like protein n=1 Tax=Xylona heveae (strain CBS 132557 / TC161) TaxID=1328760 RepID=A0A161U1N4_XYLHT|nr:WD40 repeat-like protein [Xylona heveae TC161]KZF19904.1 WD40 repeat-like protein [Xylona heveae TC161]